MLTDKRRFEIIKACDGLINSLNITEFGKKEAEITKEKMRKHLILYGYDV